MYKIVSEAYAQTQIQTNFNMPGDTWSVALFFPTIGSLVSVLLENAFVIAGVIFFALVVFGGITYMLNAGSGDKEGMEKGKNALTWAVFGFIMIFVSYWVVVILQKITGVKILEGP